MCLFCEEHVVPKLWYLDPQVHYSSGLVHRALTNYALGFVPRQEYNDV